MDFTLSLSSDWFNLIGIPLILLTIKDVIPNWKSMWDKKLSMEDRRLIMRMVIFLVLPAVVFIHELGHLLAALQVGAKVCEFHYGPVTGHVSVDSNLPAESLLWIAVAGNLAQVVVGLISLGLAATVRYAPLIVFFVYLGLFSIGDTVIFYAALSAVSAYGDWSNIYSSPCSNLVFLVGLVHGALIAFVMYCVTASAPRLWFTARTMPGWIARHSVLEEEAKRNPSPENQIALASSFIDAGLYKEAETCVRRAEAADADSPVITYLKADLEMARSNIDKALDLYNALSRDGRISDTMKAQVFLQMGEIWMYRRNTEKALDCFESACKLDSLQGDALLQKAILKANLKEYSGLEDTLALLSNPEISFVYKRNQENAAAEIERLNTVLNSRKA